MTLAATTHPTQFISTHKLEFVRIKYQERRKMDAIALIIASIVPEAGFESIKKSNSVSFAGIILCNKCCLRRFQFNHCLSFSFSLSFFFISSSDL